jgi:UDP-N-acetylmuramoylalanine--D-glutamate ligase
VNNDDTIFAARGPVMVLGWGRSGRAAAALLVGRGRRVLAWDDRGIPESEIGDGVVAVNTQGVRQPDTALADVAAVVVSPGVPAGHPVIVAALARALPIVSELELAFRALDAPVLAVTGTNGKSTTVSVLGKILEAAGFRTFVGGNLGVPLCEAVGSGAEAVVAEVSSFQLEWVQQFRPKVAVLLEVTPDHLDRHGDFETYLATKLRLFAAQSPSDAAVVDAHAGLSERVATAGPAPITTFGLVGTGGQEQPTGATADPAERRISAPNGFEVGLGSEWPVAPHDFRNAAAAVEAARLFGISARACEQGLSEFRPLPHRLARVATVAGIQWWSDSKATNVAAARSALGAFDVPVVLLVGGSSKKEDFAGLAETSARIKLVIAYGAAGDEIEQGLDGRLPLARAANMTDAVALAGETAEAGEVVLLAPACASFDEFRDYVHRSERFHELVAGLERTQH